MIKTDTLKVMVLKLILETKIIEKGKKIFVEKMK